MDHQIHNNLETSHATTISIVFQKKCWKKSYEKKHFVFKIQKVFIFQLQFWKRLERTCSLRPPYPLQLRRCYYHPFALVVAKERHIIRLDADMVIIRGQLAEKDALMVDIVRLLDSNILTNLDGVKRQLEVGYLKK